MTAVVDDLRQIGASLISASPADTVACAFGIGAETLGGYDDSDGRFFDLASLTKPLFTVPAVLGLLTDASQLDRRVADDLDWVPRSAGSPRIRGLLTHSAGLPDEMAPGVDPGALHAWLSDRILEARRDPWVRYSDPSYVLLGLWVARRAGRPLASVFADSPNAAQGGFRFGEVPAEVAVPAGPVTEGMRRVHDPAARLLGPSGHAGAFGTLSGVVDAVGRWLEPGRMFEPELAEAVVACQTHETPGGHRSLAWTLAGDPYHAVAHDWPPTTLTHTGFTGVSIALDPVSRWWAVYLSNAIPIDRDPTPVLIARRMFHATVASFLRAATTRNAR